MPFSFSQSHLCLQITFPEPHEWNSNFIISLDGVHCRFHEEKHATLGENPENYSHKYHGAGISYELALHLFQPRLVWVQQNTKTSTNDRRNFVQNGLRDRIPPGKKAITDQAYHGKGGDIKVSAPNSDDAEELRTFKARARMRQAAFHGQLKRMSCLTAQFRHGKKRHVTCFEAL